MVARIIGGAFAVLGVSIAVATACSITTSLDGLTGSARGDDVDASIDRGNVEGGSDAAAPSDAASDANGDVHVIRKIYALGGSDAGNLQGAVAKDVVAAEIQADGTLGSWMPSTPLSNTVFGNSAVTSDHFAFLVGGWGGAGSTGTVLFADLSGSAEWMTTSPFSPGRGGGAASALEQVFMGGSQLQQAHVLSAGGISPWSDLPNLPGSLTASALAYWNGFLYALGETDFDGGIINMHTKILYAPLGADGGLGAWIDPGVSVPHFGDYGVTVVAGHLYLIAGRGYDNEAIATAYVVDLAADGTPSAFKSTAPLPAPRSDGCVTSSATAVYVMGGELGQGNTTVYDSVYVGVPASDGSIGFWKATTPLPFGRTSLSCFAY